MLNRIYLQTKKEYDTGEAAAQIRYAISQKSGVDIPDFEVHEIIELKGEIDERSLTFLKNALISQNCEIASSKRSPIDTTFTVMRRSGRSDERTEEIRDILKLCGCDTQITVRTGKEYCFERKLTQREHKTVSAYLRNPVTEVVPSENETTADIPAENETAEGFNTAQYTELAEFKEKYSLELDIDDMMSIQNYFLSESREPTFAEINIIDRFFSEAFRHTTFETILDTVEFHDQSAKSAWDNYRALSKNETVSLSDMTRIASECITHETDLNISDRVHGIKIANDSGRDLLLSLRIGSRNASVTAEPYSGAAYCLGANLLGMFCRLGDVYDAYRISGTDKTDSTTFRAEKALMGYSELAAKTGVPCSRSIQLIGDAFSDKKLEISAVLATADLDDISRISGTKTEQGDIIFLLGGKTGKDGPLCARLPSSDDNDSGEIHENIQGEHVPVSQPGILNALRRLCSNPETAHLVRGIYHVGVGGIACAIGRIADGVTVNAEKIPLKYSGLSVSEIMLSESRERVIAAVSPENAARFRDVCQKENLSCTDIAEVNNSERFVVTYNGRRIVSLTRDFLINGGTEKHLSAVVEKPEPAPQSEALKIARAPLEGVSPLKKLFSKDIKCDFEGAVRHAFSELSDVNQDSSLRFDETAGNNLIFPPFSESSPAASVRYITRGGRHVTKKKRPVCSAVGYGLYPEISIADPYKGAYLSVTEAVLKLAVSGYGDSHAFIALSEYLPKYRNNSKQFGIAVSSLLGALEAQVALGASSLGGKLSMGNSAKTEKHSAVTAFAVCVGAPENAITRELKTPGHRVILLKPEYERSGILPLPESQKNIISAFTDMAKAHKIHASNTVTGRCALTALLEMCRSSGLGFEIDSERTLEQLFDYCYGAVLAEISDDTPLPKDAVYLGKITENFALSYNKDTISLSRLFDEHQKIEQTNSISILPQKRDYLYLRNISDNYGNTVTVSGSYVNVVLPVNSYSIGINDIKALFETVGAKSDSDVRTKCVPYGTSEQSVSALLSAIDRADILYIPDCGGNSSFTCAFFSLPEVKEKLSALRARGGLIYGEGNGAEVLIHSGLLELDTERIGVCGCPVQGPVNTLTHIRAVSPLSPFMRLCEPDRIYDSILTGKRLRLTGDYEYLNTLAYEGRIAAQFSDENITGSISAIDAITSADGHVFAQLSRPQRLISTGKFRILPTILSAVGYFTTENNKHEK